MISYGGFNFLFDFLISGRMLASIVSIRRWLPIVSPGLTGYRAVTAGGSF